MIRFAGNIPEQQSNTPHGAFWQRSFHLRGVELGRKLTLAFSILLNYLCYFVLGVSNLFLPGSMLIAQYINMLKFCSQRFIINTYREYI